MYINKRGKGKAVVLIHGWGFSGKIWEDLLEGMKNKYKFFIIDLPGMGDSSIIKPYKIDNLIKEIHKQIPNKVTMIGWSLGAQIAMKYSLKYPRNINHLICISSTPCFIKKPGWDYGVDKNFFIKFKKELSSNWQKALKNFFLLQLIRNKRYKNILMRFEKYFIKIKPPTKEGLEKALNLLEDIDLRDDVEKINTSTLIITSKKDMVCSYKASIWLQSAIKGSQIFLCDSSGHIPFINHKKKCIQLIDEFIKVN